MLMDPSPKPWATEPLETRTTTIWWRPIWLKKWDCIVVIESIGPELMIWDGLEEVVETKNALQNYPKLHKMSRNPWPTFYKMPRQQWKVEVWLASLLRSAVNHLQIQRSKSAAPFVIQTRSTNPFFSIQSSSLQKSRPPSLYSFSQWQRMDLPNCTKLRDPNPISLNPICTQSCPRDLCTISKIDTEHQRWEINHVAITALRACTLDLLYNW